jgi:ankyrin repeat protein
MNGHCDSAQLLLHAGAVVDMQDKVNTKKYYPEYQHVYRNDIYLLNMKQNDGWTALHYAVMSGHRECSQLLLRAGAIIDTKDAVGAVDVLTDFCHVYTHHISF